MKTLQQVLLCAFLVALTALVGYTAMLIHVATQSVAAIPGEIAATRTALLEEARAARRDLLVRSERQIAALRIDTLAQVSQIRETADRRIGDTLTRADTALDTVNQLRQDLKPALDHSAAITAQIDDSLPLFLDCDHNPDCLFNRYVGASQGIERAALNFGQASQDIRGALPKMLLTWNQIGVDVSGTAGNVQQLTKPHWYDRLLGYALNGIVIYRNLNPVTNLSLKAAQTLAARP
ncbi:MAG TPA: hypothetical protein VG456_19690 [Candidatus Sulfopaludibacter sp.]|jgi:hypothetical protein|nr:hypothetical protein [Candidatus Sulfopaludibacter sp.]